MWKYIIMPASARGENQAVPKIKRKSNSKIHSAISECGVFVKFIVTEGIRADCKEAVNLTEQRNDDCILYRFKHIIENIVLASKRWRIATCYAKTLDIFIAFIYVVVSLCYFNSLFFFISLRTDTI